MNEKKSKNRNFIIVISDFVFDNYKKILSIVFLFMFSDV